MLKHTFTILFIGLLLAGIGSGCVRQEPEFNDGLGKRPVYISPAELEDIHSEPPRSITTSGTIFLRDTLFFMLEQRKGIHVFSLKDSLNTVNLVFLKIPAITDFTVTGNYIYADSWRDLVVIDISDLNQIRETARIRDALTPALFPPLYRGIFECVDESKGAVIDWQDAVLENAKCSVFN